MTDDLLNRIQVLQAERKKLVDRGIEINTRMPRLARTDPERAVLVGEKAGLDLRLKQVNAELAQAQREANSNQPDPLGRELRKLQHFAAEVSNPQHKRLDENDLYIPTGENAVIQALEMGLGVGREHLVDEVRRLHGKAVAFDRQGFAGGLDNRNLAAIVAMHALIGKCSDASGNLLLMEGNLAQDIAHGAWDVADAMYPRSSLDDDDDDDRTEGSPQKSTPEQGGGVQIR